MIHEVTRIDPISLAKMCAAISFVMTLLFAIPVYISMRLSWPLEVGFQGNFLIAMPLAYLVFGFIFGLLIAFVYNLAAKFLGGLKLELDGKTREEEE